jgi:YggT family protein
VADYLIGFVNLVIQLLAILLILNALASFVVEPWHPARQFLERLAEPILRPIRNILPPAGMLDLSPMVALIALQIIGQVLIWMIRASF